VKLTAALVALSLAAAAACGAEEARAPEPEEPTLVDWIAAHPDRVSVLASGAGDELAWRPARPRPIASTFKLLVLAAYAREVAAGRLDPEARVARAELERWYLAGTDGGAHERALAAIALPLTLDGAVRAMVEFSDNAATDHLLDVLGRERVLAAARALGVDALGAGVAPVTGALLALADRGLGATVDRRIRRLRSLPVGERARIAWRLAAGYREDPERALAGLERALRKLGPWSRQVALADALPWRGSARELGALVRAALGGGEAAATMARHLSWPLADPALAARFERLGAKEGETAGVLAVAGYARPAGGPWAGRDRIVVLLLEGMHAASWQAAHEAFTPLALELAESPAAVARLREALDR
jgi:hypothetical protein